MYKTVENKKIDEKYYYIDHESGLDIYIIPKNHTSTYALFATKYGSVDNIFKLEGEEEFTHVPEGISHFLEHKMFENEDGVDTFKKYAETGASANAYASFDRTCYLFSVADNGENFDKSLEILLEFVSRPYFTEQTVKKEQGIIAQEIRMYEDEPGWQVYFQMLANMYQKHSIRLDICGTDESIAKITADILYKCYNTFYNLGNMALCISGDVTPEQVKKTADKILKKTAPAPVERYKYDEPEAVLQNYTEKKLKVSRPLFCIGLKDSEVGLFGRDLLKKSKELGILSEMLFSKSSEFFTRMYNAGKIDNSFGVGNVSLPEYGYMVHEGEADNPQEIFDEIMKEYEEKIKNGLSREDFELCKRRFYAWSITTFDSTSSIANAFVSGLFAGCDLLDIPEIVAGITFEDVENRLKKLFKRENFVLSVVNPLD
ncbi:MAG: insulinase family protein [Oscillospiraceae bacterium]|nr:insulinase family protein [Oscillospiraceae bacterium]